MGSALDRCGARFASDESDEHPVTVNGVSINPLKENFRVIVVLRKEGRIIAAQHGWYSVP